MRAVHGLLLASLGAAGCGGSDSAPCSEPGTVCTWAGTPGDRGFNNENPEAPRLESRLYFPADLMFTPDGRAYISDYNNHRIRRVELDDRIVTVVGNDVEGDGAPEQEDRLPLGAPVGALGTDVSMNHPTDMELGPDGKLYIAAWHNNKIRVLEPDTDRVTVLGGDSYGFSGDGGPCYLATFNQPKSIVIAADGTIYTNDQRNVRIRRITPDGIIDTISGTGAVGNAGDSGAASDAEWGFDTGTTPQPSGGLLLIDSTLYVADSANNRIRAIDLATMTVSAVAGDAAGSAGYADGAAADARFAYPTDLELGPDGLIYIADRYNNAVRTLDRTTGMVATVAGTAAPCSGDTCIGDEGLPARETQLNNPYGIAFDGAGALYIADSHNHRIVRVTP
jgi:sugar lactone lactonase YvrE